jgi:predicted hydrocarbon binding protein
MKGIVFNLLEEIVVREHGEEIWEQLLDGAGLDGVYTSLGNYPDADLGALVAAATSALSLPADEVVRWFGRHALPLLAERYPALFEPHEDVRSFVLTLNEIIHPEVRKLYPGADTPVFVFDVSDPQRVVMEYRSARRLCAFAEGLLLGAGDHWAQPVAVAQPACMNRGDDRCLIEIDLGRAATATP